MHPRDHAKYLEIRRQRTHFAIKAKRVLGEWVPQTGDIKDADALLTKMRNDLINYRVAPLSQNHHVQNMLTALRRSQDPISTLLRYCSPSGSNRRQFMTARQIAYRLGYIDVRSDRAEKVEWVAAQQKNYQWLTRKTITLDSGLQLPAGSEVRCDAQNFFFVDFHTLLTPDQTKEARIYRRRRPKK